MSVLVVAEHDGEQLKALTLSTITAATQLADFVTVLIAGSGCGKVVEQAAQLDKVSQVINACNIVYKYPLAERIAPLVVHHATAFTHILAPATTFGKNLLPRVAALLDVGQISDIIKIIDQETFCRPVYAGNAIAKVKSLDSKKVVTVRPTAFEPIKVGSSMAETLMSDFVTDNAQSEFVSEETHASDRPELSSAEIVISGGRGLQNEETFQRLTAIADKMNAAIGASRAAVDAGFAPNDCQVGQTGQVVAPKLYIAVGISGAIQHMAGMKDSKVIVAINKDPDAPIFQIADYGLVADVNEVLPQWEAVLEE